MTVFSCGVHAKQEKALYSRRFILKLTIMIFCFQTYIADFNVSPNSSFRNWIIWTIIN